MKALFEKIEVPALAGNKVAAFDTRLTWWWLRPFGYAAPKIAKGLERRGGELVIPAEGFFVTGGEGPLKEGEIERAAAWAKEVMAAVEGAATKGMT
jgi:flavodoxin